MFLREARLLLTAWVFFTRVPLPARLAAWVGYSPAMLRGSARYFPAVGQAVGLGGALVWLAAQAVWPPAVAVALSMMATVLLTGAFHEDGFADSCDGFGGGYTRERVMEIMADSRVGAFGAIGITLMLLAKFACLASLAATGAAAWVAWVLVLGHGASRAGAVGLMRFLAYVRADAGPKAKPLADGISGGAFAVALLLAAAPFAVCARAVEGGWVLALGLVPVALAALLAGAYFRRRIGGYTGDCLGAAQQVCELAFYLFACAAVTGPRALAPAA